MLDRTSGMLSLRAKPAQSRGFTTPWTISYRITNTGTLPSARTSDV